MLESIFNSLIIENSVPEDLQTPHPNQRLILFGRPWLELQLFAQQIDQIPIDQNNWESLYGLCQDQKLITDILAALRNMHDIMSEFGNSMAVRQQIEGDSSYLSSETPPDTISAHIIWFISNMQEASDDFEYILTSLKDVLSSSSGSEEERADRLKAILIGQDGLISTAMDMKQKNHDLIRKFGLFLSRLKEAKIELQKYIRTQSKLLSEAAKQLDIYVDDLEKLQVTSQNACVQWLDHTIETQNALLPIANVSAGLIFPVPFFTSENLNLEGKRTIKAYNSLVEELSIEEEEVQKKAHLVLDLAGTNYTLDLVDQTLFEIQAQLELIENLWINTLQDLNNISNNSSIEQLSSFIWVKKTLQVDTSTGLWHCMSRLCQDFISSSLVNFYQEHHWGQEFPTN